MPLLIDECATVVYSMSVQKNREKNANINLCMVMIAEWISSMINEGYY